MQLLADELSGTFRGEALQEIASRDLHHAASILRMQQQFVAALDPCFVFILGPADYIRDYDEFLATRKAYEAA